MQEQPDFIGTFGTALAFYRKRARLTQSELGRAVGYSREQITRLERNRRVPDTPTIAARFLPALGIAADSSSAKHLLGLAQAANHPRLTTGHPSPVIKTLDNLPAPLLPIIGRERELEQLLHLLQGNDTRLITVVGPAGVGKTRLVTQTAHLARSSFRDGVCFVSLAAVTDPALLSVEILQALGLTALVTSDPEEALLKELAHRQLLLVLDNLEQLADEPSVIPEILVRSPHVNVLTTSRSPLMLYGEQQFDLKPLPLPDVAGRLSELASNPAVQLFISRARLVSQDLELSAENSADIVTLCIGLDGLPLAIELAAAQLRRTGIPELCAGLSDSALAMEFPARNVPARHHSLNRALEWSYTHLAAEQQRVFEYLGIFAGGATEPQVRALAGVADALPSLIELTRTSLVQAQLQQFETRYTLYETVKQFAREKLLERGELERAEQEHVKWFAELAERAEPHLTGADQKSWLERLEKERDNLRRAIAVSLRSETARSGLAVGTSLRLCNALWKFWRYRCDLAEGYEWTTRALAAADSGPEMFELRAGAEWGAGVLAAVMQDEAQATAHLENSLRLSQALEDEMGIAAALTALGARAMYRGEYARAVELQQDALELYTQVGDRAGMAYAYNALGESLRASGDYTASREQYQASLALAREARHERSIAVAQSNLASIDLALGNIVLARENLMSSLTTFIALNDRVNIASCIATIACVDALADEGARSRRAAYLFGLAEKLIAVSKGKFEAADAREYAIGQARTRETLGEDNFERERNRGSRSTLEQAIGLLASE
jgi:predicted ATPase/DNA-binding XRE family transcriptional regulator